MAFTAEGGGYVDCFVERPGVDLGVAQVWYGLDVMHRFQGETYVTPYTSLRLAHGPVVIDVEVAAGAELETLAPRWKLAITAIYVGGD